MQTRKLRKQLRRSRSIYSRSRKTRQSARRQSGRRQPLQSQPPHLVGERLYSPPKVVYGRIHATWCGHCQHLEKMWPSVIREINNKTKKGEYKAVSIEQTEEAKKLPWVNKHFVKSGAPLAIQGGYPTVFKIVNGGVQYYNGERTAKGIAEFVCA
jgi:hypothetical protein